MEGIIKSITASPAIITESDTVISNLSITFDYKALIKTLIENNIDPTDWVLKFTSEGVDASLPIPLIDQMVAETGWQELTLNIPAVLAEVGQ